jgi:hypothetical protein
MRSLKSILIISIVSFLLLELGFYLEGFLQFVLFSLVLIIYFVLLFLFYGYLKDKERDKSKTFVFVLLVALPLVSALFNPTFYLHGINEKNVMLVASKNAGESIKRTATLTLLKDSTYQLKEYGFWMNTEHNGKFEIRNKRIILELPGFKYHLKIRNMRANKKICTLKTNRKTDYSNCFLIEKVDNNFVKEISK